MTVPLALILAVLALTGASAKLSSALLGASTAWRERAAELARLVDAVGADVDGAPFIHHPELQAAQLQRLQTSTADAVSLAMRMTTCSPWTGARARRPSTPRPVRPLSCVSCLSFHASRDGIGWRR